MLHQAGHALQFIVVGGGAPIDKYTALARQHGAEQLVQFTGHREDIPEVLRAIDVLCIPSVRHEGVPQIGLQALASGTSVVGSDCGGIPEIIQEGRTGRIFPAGDAVKLASRILETFQDTDATNRMIHEGRKLVESKYNLDLMLDQLETIYANHLGLK
jgi:glycosyltransferase involved in cell wall biosynthesis